MHRPARTSCSRCLCPDGRTIRHDVEHRSGTLAPSNLIPVTNPIESVFATVRHRTVRTKASLSPTTARLMVSNFSSPHHKTGGGSKAQISCRRSSQVSVSETASKSSAGKPRRLIIPSPKIPHSSIIARRLCTYIWPVMAFRSRDARQFCQGALRVLSAIECTL